MATSICRFCGHRDLISNLVEVCTFTPSFPLYLSPNQVVAIRRVIMLCAMLLVWKTTSRKGLNRKTTKSAMLLKSALFANSLSELNSNPGLIQNSFFLPFCLRWSTDRICSGVSLGQCFNLAMIVLASLGFFVSVANVLASEDRRSKRIRPLTWVMAVVVAIMTAFVFRVIYKRWKRQQIELELVDIV